MIEAIIHWKLGQNLGHGQIIHKTSYPIVMKHILGTKYSFIYSFFLINKDNSKIENRKYYRKYYVKTEWDWMTL